MQVQSTADSRTQIRKFMGHSGTGQSKGFRQEVTHRTVKYCSNAGLWGLGLESPSYGFR